MLRLVGLLGGLSVAMDMGTGAPLEESLRRCVVADRLSAALGCSAEARRDALFGSLLEHLGCTAYTHELAAVFGDDIAAVRAGFLADPADPRDLLRTLARLVAETSGRSRVRTVSAALLSGRRVDAEGPVATCEVARAAALRLGLPDSVQDCLGHVTAMWDGSGHPSVGGEHLPVGARMMHVASVATTFALVAGPDRALLEVQRRVGTQLDPRIAAAVTREMLEDLADLDAYATVLATEPEPVQLVADEEVVAVACTFGDLADLKSPWLHGHSAAVAALATGAGEQLGLPGHTIHTLRVAGHLHDLGRVGVSSRIWDKAKPLTSTERAQVELHPWHTEQVLSRVPELAGAARVAAQHHERLDGSGYHRGAVAGQLGVAARVLAAADRYRGLVEERPHRPALSAEAAAAAVRDDVRRGLLDPEVVEAVVASAGLPRRARPGQRGGLTRRQVDVLRLLAAGRSNREIAAELVISPRTAEHHVQDVYARIGVATRAGAALYAMEHGLLDREDG
jgi:HD-GYP domain-containing protein (c-di-GMP phosphodiesterase class II)/DNA-binding CsgD family transcriptional regulator